MSLTLRERRNKEVGEEEQECSTFQNELKPVYLLELQEIKKEEETHFCGGPD